MRISDWSSDVCSSDLRAAAGGDVNARYGVDPGFSFYTHVSDQHGPYHVRVLSAATHEAPYVLDGLLHHGSELAITEIGRASCGKECVITCRSRWSPYH